MKTSEMKESKYIKGSDVGEGGMLLTIRGDVAQDNVAMEGEPEKLKYTVEFEEIEKPLVLNSTNIDILERLHGPDTEDWVGKQVIVYFDPNVAFKGKVTGGLRIRSAAPVAPRQPQAPRRPAPAAPSRPASNARPQRANEPEPNFDNVP
jgi:hypothetical protein